MVQKKTFTPAELDSLSAEEIITKIKNENYSLLKSLDAEKLRKEMVPVGKACHLVAKFFSTPAKLSKALKKITPARYDSAEFPTDSKHGLVIGFNHPSLGEIPRLIALKMDLMGDKPMLFPVNLPWYEAIAPDHKMLEKLGIIITPTITPSTWKKLNLAEDSPLYEPTNRLKRSFRNIYTSLSQNTVKNGGIIFVAPSATRQATVFKSKTVYDKQEEIIPTMSVLALKLYADPDMSCDFLPVAILPPTNYGRSLNLFKPYTILANTKMTATAIRKKYFTTAHPKRLENFDYDFHAKIAAKLPKSFWY